MRLTRTASAALRAWVGLVVMLASATGVRADPLPTSAEHVATPGRSVASDDTARRHRAQPRQPRLAAGRRAPLDVGELP